MKDMVILIGTFNGVYFFDKNNHANDTGSPNYYVQNPDQFQSLGYLGEAKSLPLVTVVVLALLKEKTCWLVNVTHLQLKPECQPIKPGAKIFEQCVAFTKKGIRKLVVRMRRQEGIVFGPDQDIDYDRPITVITDPADRLWYYQAFESRDGDLTAEAYVVAPNSLMAKEIAESYILETPEYHTIAAVPEGVPDLSNYKAAIAGGAKPIVDEKKKEEEIVKFVETVAQPASTG